MTLYPGVDLLPASGPPNYVPGSRDDFDRLYRDSYARILRTLAGVLGDASAAEDCAQEAFVAAFKAWPRWRPSAPAEAWLHRIAINTAISYKRKARLRTVGEVLRRLGRPGATPDPAELVVDRDLFRTLRSLPPRQAAALVLRHYHGYTNRDIAAALGVSERTVNKRISTAAARMRKLLHEPGPGFPLGVPASLSTPEPQVARRLR